MIFFKKNKGYNNLLKLYKAVSQSEAELYNTKNLIDFLLVEFENLNLKLNNFYITGPYPNNGWKTKKGFLNGLNRKNYRNIHHMMISDQENKMDLDFQNWSHNRTIEIKCDSISIELMFDEDLISKENLISLSKKMYNVFNFEYGYIFKQSKNYSISEGKIKNRFFSYHESENPMYKKWSIYDSSTKFGFLRNVYEINFLSQKHLEKEELNELVKKFGKSNNEDGFSVWSLDKSELEKVKNELKTSSIIVENNQFDKTEICRQIDYERDKLTKYF